MYNIEVCLSPELIHLYQPEGKTVVVTDIFRATSCMVSGLAKGVKQIKTVAEIEESVPFHEQGYFRAGERNGNKIEGFELGNSPFDFIEEQYIGERIVMTTTNGTRAISLSQKADQIVIGAFLNLKAVTEYLSQPEKDLLIVCAGWKGRFSMEDTLFAGALCSELKDNYESNDDSALAANSLYQLAKNDLYGYLLQASHTKRLDGLKFKKDIHFCLDKNQFSNVPVLKEGFIENA
ncbi:2-phosphosulfolactate phosphatase [Chondrinema litorale]|uniref:2-phosphosulfolactate phosphatase n=1 Tax=Chondrinema litorale TaxID=2994555 RepID=UPI0025438914|nr:2-phosphosulfolactate phosphatase [Chondrinema litorale]UZR94489.1 2-phosphosulfolactate phosphatase [Chondrinema litorale]